MSLKEQGIQHKETDPTLVAVMGFNLKQRADLPAVMDRLRAAIPAEIISGPAFCIYRFVSTRFREGYDVEVGLPVKQAIRTEEIESKVLPGMEVLALVHEGPVDKLRESYAKLYGYTAERGLISDEFSREIYLNDGDPLAGPIELHFVIHDWPALLSTNLERVLGETSRREVMGDGQAPTVESTVAERFQWAKGAMQRLDCLADEAQKYDIVSSCAHIFPAHEIAQLKAIYQDARAQVDDPLQAVDAVIAHMRGPVWGQETYRQGRVIYTTKGPRDPKGFEDAQDDLERRRAYCFCPVLRPYLDEGMPITYCYCGAGWYRRQWEEPLGRPVRIDVVKSVLQGDECCQFAIHLPEDL